MSVTRGSEDLRYVSCRPRPSEQCPRRFGERWSPSAVGAARRTAGARPKERCTNRWCSATPSTAAEARLRGVEITIVCDLIHVLDIPCPHCTPILSRCSPGPDAISCGPLSLGSNRSSSWPLSRRRRSGPNERARAREPAQRRADMPSPSSGREQASVMVSGRCMRLARRSLDIARQGQGAGRTSCNPRTVARPGSAVRRTGRRRRPQTSAPGGAPARAAPPGDRGTRPGGRHPSRSCAVRSG